MAYKDFREFLQALEATGDLVRVEEEVDWDLEVGAINRLSGETNTPAACFEKLTGYPRGSGRICIRSTYGRPRVAVALEMGRDTSLRTVKDEVARRLQTPIKPVVVSTGPCKENILKGEDVDLYRLPVPMLSGGDGGRFLGTLDIVITKDPDSDWVNWGTYRMMVHDRRHTGILLPQNQAGMLFYSKWVPKGQPMPIAVVIGADPACHLAAPIKFPAGSSEVDYAGALRREPVELVKCETSDLLVPASAEIILEGVILPDVELREGPFAEWTGHQSSFSKSPVFRVNCMTFRNNPIITIGMVALSDQEGTVVGLVNEMNLESFLRERGIPLADLHAVESTNGAALAISIHRSKGQSANIASQVAAAVWAYNTRAHPSIIIVLDDDVDVYSPTEVLHAVAMRCHPGRGIHVNKNAIPNHLIPWLSRDERRWLRGATVIIDATWPPDWNLDEDVPPRVTFRESFPEEVQEHAARVWSSYTNRRS